MGQLKIAFVNICGIRKKITETLQFAEDEHIDILLLNEIKIKPHFRLHTGNYHLFQHAKQTSKGGTAILCRKNLPVSEIPLPPQFQNSPATPLIIAVKSHPQPIYISTLYVHPRDSLDTYLPFITFLSNNFPYLLLQWISTANTTY